MTAAIAENTVNQIDALELLRALPEASVDVIVTDLPYGVFKAEWDSFIPLHWIDEAWRVTNRMLIMPGITYMPECINAVGRFRDILAVYIKNGMTRAPIGFQNWFPVIAFGDWGYESRPNLFTSTIIGSKGLHPSPKPLDAMTKMLRWYTRPGDLVVDPFGGSGTTAVAARNLGRRWITGDTDAGYCEIMRRRLAEPYTPQLFAEEADAVDDAPRQVEMFEATP